MRLSEKELSIIKLSFKKHFTPNDHLWLFGSRVDDTRKGGDIDLYVETELSAKDAVQAKIRFDADLMILIGEQRIDIVLNLVHDKTELQIYQIARETGISLL